MRIDLPFSGMLLLCGGVGAVTGWPVMAATFAAAAAMSRFMARNADRLALSAVGAIEVDKQTVPALVNLVERLAARAGVPRPRVFLIPNAEPNAYSTSWRRRPATLAVSTGLLENASREELAGTLAHELAHIKNGDASLIAEAAVLASTAAWAPQIMFLVSGVWTWLVVALLAGMTGAWLRAWLYRVLELRADQEGAKICGEPEWIVSALRTVTGLQPTDVEIPDWFSPYPTVAGRIARLAK